MEEPGGGPPSSPDWTSQWAPPAGTEAPPPSYFPPPPPQAGWAPPQYAPPPREHRPAISPPGYPLYIIYTVVMSLLYVATLVFGYYLLNTDDFSGTDRSPEEIRLQGLIMLVVSGPLILLFVVGIFVPKRPWGWVYGLVLVCFGLTSCCTWPLTIPILIKWIKPEMKRYFRKR